MKHFIRRPGVRTLIAPAVLAAASLATVAGCSHRGSNDSPQVRAAEDAAPLHVATAVARAREIPQVISATGTLVPDQQSEVTPIVAGRVTEVLVERGSIVREGQPLMRLRDVDFRSQASAASASLEQARARLGVDAAGNARFDPEHTAEVRAARANRDLAEDTLRRTEVLEQSGSVSPQEVERARSQAAAAREQYNTALNGVRGAYFGYRNAQVAVAQSRRSVDDSTIRAPFAGEISERRANVGEYVTPQRAVVTLVTTNPLRVELQIPQERTPFVRRGQDVELTIDGFPGQTFHGTIRYISAALRADSRALVAEAVVPNTDGALRPGLFATARIALEQRVAAVVVPTAAVLSEAGIHRVFVVANGRVQERVVAVAERTPDGVLLSRGVQPNEVVATESLERLGDGTRVTQ